MDAILFACQRSDVISSFLKHLHCMRSRGNKGCARKRVEGVCVCVCVCVENTHLNKSWGFVGKDRIQDRIGLLFLLEFL